MKWRFTMLVQEIYPNGIIAALEAWSPKFIRVDAGRESVTLMNLYEYLDSGITPG